MSNLKIEVARLQLGTAMDLYLRGLDPVSVHCLASGACEVIEFYAQKLSGKALLTGFVETKPDVSFVDLRNSQRQYWNSFKHATMPYQKGKPTAERDDDKLLKTFRDEKNDLALLIGWYDYHLATGKMPIEAQTQQAWYFALHPEKLDPKTARIYQKFFPNLRTKPRAEQKSMLNDVIERVREISVRSTEVETSERARLSVSAYRAWSRPCIRPSTTRSVDEVALIRDTISHYAPVLIAPLSIRIRRAGFQKIWSPRQGRQRLYRLDWYSSLFYRSDR